MRPSKALYLDSYVASATLEGLFQLRRKSDKIFTVFTVSAAQNSTETVNSGLKLAALHKTVSIVLGSAIFFSILFGTK